MTSCTGAGVVTALLLAAGVGGVLLLPGTAEPRWYRLELLPRAAEGVFAGRVRVNLTCRAATDTLVLHADPQLLVSAAHIAVSHPSSRAAWSAPVSVVDVQRDPERHLLVLILSRPLCRHSSYSVSLHFEGLLGGPGDQGLVRGSYFVRATNNTEWYVVTNMTLGGARKVFPCFDEPSYKAVFEVSVGTPSHQHVFSNMPLADIENVEGQPGWYWKHFSLSPLMSTFSVGIVVLEFEHFSLAEGSFHIVGPTAIENDIETTITYLQDAYEYLQDYLDLPYPLLKLDIVFVPGVYREAFASWGLIVLGEDSVREMDRAYLAREMASQWVGHLVTPRRQRERQYSSAIAMHLGHQFLLKCNHESAWDKISLYDEYGQMNIEEEEKPETEKKRDRVFWLLSMLEHSLTKKTFRAGVYRFLKSRTYRTFVEDELWAALTTQARSDRSLPQDMSVEDVVESWLSDDSSPLLSVSRDYARRTFAVTQRAFRAKESHATQDRDDTLWHIPITCLTPSNMNVSTAETHYWMKKQREITVDEELSPAEFLIINPNETGMFLVNYDPTNWALLADAIHRRVLPVAVRTKLLHDAWNLAFAGELNFNSAMNMTLYLKDETEYAVWDAMDTMFDHVGRYLDGTRAGDKFKRYLSELATGAGTVPTLLRDCARPHVNGTAQREDWPLSRTQSSGLHIDEMCNVLITTDLAEFHRALKKISRQLKGGRLQSHENAIDCFSNCIKDTEKILRLLEMVMLKENSVFTDEDVLRVLKGIARSHSGYKTLFLFLRQNFEKLSRIFEDKPKIWRLVVQAGTSAFTTEEGLQMVLQLYRERRYQLGTAEYVLRASIDQISSRIRWTKKNTPVIEHFLNHHFYLHEATRTHF